MKNYSGKLQQLLYLIVSLLLVMAISLRRDGKVLGHDLKQQQEETTKTDTMTVLEDGSCPFSKANVEAFFASASPFG